MINNTKKVVTPHSAKNLKKILWGWAGTKVGVWREKWLPPIPEIGFSNHICIAFCHNSIRPELLVLTIVEPILIGDIR